MAEVTITFEDGTLGEWTGTDTGGGDLSVTTGAAKVGSYGQQAYIDDQDRLYGNYDWGNKSELRFGFYINFDGFTIPRYTQMCYFGCGSTFPGGADLRLYLKHEFDYTLRVWFSQSNDSGAFGSVSSTVTLSGSGWHWIEYHGKIATGAGQNDGFGKLWVDADVEGTPSVQVTGIDNDTCNFRAFAAGTNLLAATHSGYIYWDHICANDTGAAIGEPSGVLEIKPSGIASLEAFGAASITTGAVSIEPAGIGSAEAFGAARVVQVVYAEAIASAEAFGAAIIVVGSVSITPTGIASAEALGALRIEQRFSIRPAGIASLETFGEGRVMSTHIATELLDLIVRVAGMFGPLHEGVAEAGSTSQIVDHTVIEPDDFWNNHYIYVTGAGGLAPEREERSVSDWDQATGVLSVVPTFTAAVESGDTYLILSARRADLVRAINTAIVRAAESWGIPAIDTTTVVIAADTYQYSLPSDLVWLADVLYRTGADAPWRPIERGNWSISGTVGAQKMDMLDISRFTAGDVLRLDYVQRIPAMTADSDVLAIGGPAEPELLAFLVDYALWYLHEQAGSYSIGSGGSFREHYTMARQARENAERLLGSAPTWRRAGRWHTPQRSKARG